jgi:hypothetical protein
VFNQPLFRRPNSFLFFLFLSRLTRLLLLFNQSINQQARRLLERGATPSVKPPCPLPTAHCPRIDQLAAAAAPAILGWGGGGRRKVGGSWLTMTTTTASAGGCSPSRHRHRRHHHQQQQQQQQQEAPLPLQHTIRDGPPEPSFCWGGGTHGVSRRARAWGSSPRPWRARTVAAGDASPPLPAFPLACLLLQQLVRVDRLVLVWRLEASVGRCSASLPEESDEDAVEGGRHGSPHIEFGEGGSFYCSEAG